MLKQCTILYNVTQIITVNVQRYYTVNIQHYYSDTKEPNLWGIAVKMKLFKLGIIKSLDGTFLNCGNEWGEFYAWRSKKARR